MRFTKPHHAVLSILAAAVLLSSAGMAGADDEKVDKTVTMKLRGAAQKYWLGVHVAEVPEVLDKHLKLEGQGLIVRLVSPESPAAKAGIEADQIILKIKGKPVSKQTELQEAVNTSEGKEMTVVVLKGGERATVNVVPAESPASVTLDFPDTAVWESLLQRREGGGIERELMEKIEEATKTAKQFELRLAQPGIALPKGMRLKIAPTEFPDDLKVQVTKQGKGPAKIEVARGDKSWSVTEESLAELPDDVRTHVETLLGRGTGIVVAGTRVSIDEDEQVERGARRGDSPATRAERTGRRRDDRLSELRKQLDEMQSRLDEMRKSLRDE